MIEKQLKKRLLFHNIRVNVLKCEYCQYIGNIFEHDIYFCTNVINKLVAVKPGEFNYGLDIKVNGNYCINEFISDLLVVINNN